VSGSETSLFKNEQETGRRGSRPPARFCAPYIIDWAHYHRAGIKPAGKLTVHTLRKCCGQNWADAGLPINVVQKLMGHSKPETTLEFYSQVDEHHERKAADAIQKTLESGKKSGKTDAGGRFTPKWGQEVVTGAEGKCL
jgi:integrase